MLVSLLSKSTWGALRTINLPNQVSPGNGVSSDDLKIAKVTPIYKAGDVNNISKYWSMSVLHYLYMILERLM